MVQSRRYHGQDGPYKTRAGYDLLVQGMGGIMDITGDPNGDMLAKFHRPGDVVLNPYDSRGVGWTFFNEIRAEYDFKRFALSLVPRADVK